MVRRRKRPQQPARCPEHEGPLYLASFFDAVPRRLIQPGRKTRDDPHQMGWRYVAPSYDTGVKFRKMEYATAEAAVALAIAVDVARRATGRKGAFRVESDGESDERFAVLGLRQVAKDCWDGPKQEWTPIGSHNTYGLWRAKVTERRSVSEVVKQIVRSIELLPSDVLGSRANEIAMAIERVAAEVAMNAFEHAYVDEDARYLYVCATIGPPRYLLAPKKQEFHRTPPEEVMWLNDSSDGLVLEIAMGDAGQGVPKTLWRNAQQAGIDLEGLAGKSLGTKAGIAARAKVHQLLCDHAFHHDSTCKDPDSFDSRAEMLNWRGLHRCLSQIAHQHGAIALASGQGRSGYAWKRHEMIRFTQTIAFDKNLPGTMVVFRVSAKSRLKGSFRRPPSAGAMPLTVHDMVSKRSLGSDFPGHCDRPVGFRAFDRDSSDVTVLLFPFERITSAAPLLDAIKRLSGDRVAAIMFADVPDGVLAELRASVQDWSAVQSGAPRLVCLWRPGEHALRWKVVGAVPFHEKTRLVMDGLEELGSVKVPQDQPRLTGFAQELALTYPSFVRFDKGSNCSTLSPFAPSLSTGDFSEALRKAFEDYWQQVQDSSAVTVAGEGEAIRLSTGRLVHRFLSILEMLWASPILAEAAGQRLCQILRSVCGASDDVCVVADGPAGYYVARLLLRGQRKAPKVSFERLFRPTRAGQRVVAFLDAVYRGETARRLVRGLQQSANVEHVIVCADLRKEPRSLSEYHLTRMVEYDAWKANTSGRTTRTSRSCCRRA